MNFNKVYWYVINVLQNVGSDDAQEAIKCVREWYDDCGRVDWLECRGIIESRDAVDREMDEEE